MTNNDDSTGTAELADQRPSEGEYFYTDDITSYSINNTHPICFACGIDESGYHTSYFIHANSQCLAAGRRIAAMFRPGACFGPIPDPHLEPSALVIISACKTHKHCAEILHRLTADGIITLGRVSRAKKALISRSEFHELVAKEALALWNRNEPSRNQHDWCDAWMLFLEKLHHIPSLTERRELARRLWLQRKDVQATEDWLAAEKKVAALYTVDAQ